VPLLNTLNSGVVLLLLLPWLLASGQQSRAEIHYLTEIHLIRLVSWIDARAVPSKDRPRELHMVGGTDATPYSL
jgi:hypothetical protein